MAERKVIDCDKCGKEISTPIRLSIPNGITRESGGHTVEIYFDYETKDLCPSCAESLLKYLLGHKKLIDKEGKTMWLYNKDKQPDGDSNDAVRLALKFFGIEEKK